MFKNFIFKIIIFFKKKIIGFKQFNENEMNENEQYTNIISG